jgi:16S rRNA (adenine1518-N6/adenine1519-N6)-dimethyltransferase
VIIVPLSHNIRLKKKFGQHFLRDKNIAAAAISRVSINPETSVFEIGCGDGFLTRAILATDVARLWVFEIDPEWARYVQEQLGSDARLAVFEDNILDVDFSRFEEHKPWTLLANLPYQITFPILYMLQKNRHLLSEGVVMVQEEVAQKVLKAHGRGYGYPSLFLQHYFDWELLNKVSPSAFYPQPKVFSRLLYFKPKQSVEKIADEKKFWKFIKSCFRQPRRTLRNNLKQCHFDLSHIDDKTLELRAQQLKMSDFLSLWRQIRKV